MKSEESKKIWQMVMGSEFCLGLQNAHENSKKKFLAISWQSHIKQTNKKMFASWTQIN